MEALAKSTVHIKNRVEVEEMISQLIKGGATKLQVIADFDHTLSRVHKNGTRCDSTYGIIDNSPLVSEEYKNKALVYFQKYHPIEVDPHLTREEKIPHMIEWYTQARDSFKETGITKDSLVQMVANSNACLRDDCDTVFKSLNEHNVPLLIFSAGVGDVLKQVLVRDKLLLPNMKFIANHLSYDENGKVSGFKDALIHTFNKDESSIQNHEYFEHVRSRDNVILLGDSLGDLDMSAGVKDVNVMLKIGFLNYKIEQNLPEYLDKFDIVLTDDQTMDVVVKLLKHIL
ncbi:hypothetical protein JTE90_025949 [Oedothorax gibbosus]|uniref:5'-nucleotidase n=1 Tax=Oedothorax gibbosus TaxID=931172 RepID=A0AAV6TW33_9ARAC|nr:hypothetical protein JTE90_025949 [Oedothorax gibbosus]